MQIARLVLQDFRGHRQFEAELGGLTVVSGPNGAGKSSLANALEWLLAGRVTGLTDVAGKGAEALLVRGAGAPGGAKKAVVEADFEGVGTIAREVPNKLRGAMLAGGVRDAERELYQVLGLPPREAVSLACNPSALAYASADEVRELLFKVLTGRLTREELLDAVEGWLGGEADTTTAVAEAALRWVAETAPARMGPQAIDRLYRSAYDSRREANGAVRALEQQIQALEQADGQTALPDGYGPADAPRIRQRLQECQQEVSRLQERIWRAEQAARQRQEAERRVAEAAAALQEKRRQVQERMGLNAGDGRPGDTAALRARYEELGRQIQTAQQQRGACPVYAGVACPLSPEVVAGHLAGLKAQRQAVLAELAHAVVREAAECLRRAEAERDGIEVPDVAGDRQRLANLQALIQREAEVLERLAAAAGRREGVEAADRRLVETRREAAKFGVLVQCFEPDGVPALLLRRQLADLEERVNRRLLELLDGDWRVRLSADGPHPILVSHPKHGAAVLRMLSRSERLLVSLAVLDALNDYHGLGLLVVDDAENVVGGNYEQLLAVLRQWVQQGKYGTVLVLRAADGPLVVQVLEVGVGVGAGAAG